MMTIVKAKTILEWLSVITITSALFGFFIVNLFLANYGLWDFSFLRTEYISAGILFMVFLFITAGPVAWAYDKTWDLKERFKKHRWFVRFGVWIGKWVIRIISLIPGYYFLSFIVFVNDPTVKSWLIFGIFFIEMFFVACSISFLHGYYKERVRGVELQPNISKIGKVLMQWLYSLVPFYTGGLLLCIVMVFSLATYPFIPHFFGGGEPVLVKINFKNNAFEATSTQAMLVYQTGDTIIFSNVTGTYSMNESEVSSVQYLESESGFRNMLPALKYGKLIPRSENK